MYIAPEVIRKEGYGPAVDIWSTAIIMYKLLKAGQHPFL
jgi:serine/threonine protein kinase